jgi:hypothetical protein
MMPDPKPNDATPGEPGLDPAALAALIDERVTAGVTAALSARDAAAPPRTPDAPPAVPSPTAAGGAGSSMPEQLAAMVDAAIGRAFKERDDEDALGLLEREVAELKASVGAGRDRRQPLWTRLLIGVR